MGQRAGSGFAGVKKCATGEGESRGCKTDLDFGDDALVVHVAPTSQVPCCSGCGKKRQCGHDSRVRSWRHIDLAGMKTVLRYRLRRVSCKKCGVLVEKVPWAESASRDTLPMEGLVAYHAQKTDKTTVSTLMRIAWRTVGEIVGRFVLRDYRRPPGGRRRSLLARA